MKDLKAQTPKVHQVKGRHVNSYIIEDDNGLCVVDVAWSGEKYVLGYLKDTLQRDPRDVNLVVCTHGDPDHIGGVEALAKVCQADIGIPYATHSFTSKFLNDPTGFLFRFVTGLVESFRPRMWAMYANPNRSLKAKELPAYNPEDLMEDSFDYTAQMDFRLKHKQTLPGFDDWQVVHTPGHSWDSCCFYHKKSGALITGDTLLGSKKKGVVVTPAIYSNPIQMRYTLNRLKRLEPKAIYPGHGSYFEGDNLLAHIG